MWGTMSSLAGTGIRRAVNVAAAVGEVVAPRDLDDGDAEREDDDGAAEGDDEGGALREEVSRLKEEKAQLLDELAAEEQRFQTTNRQLQDLLSAQERELSTLRHKLASNERVAPTNGSTDPVNEAAARLREELDAKSAEGDAMAEELRNLRAVAATRDRKRSSSLGDAGDSSAKTAASSPERDEELEQLRQQLEAQRAVKRELQAANQEAERRYEALLAAERKRAEDARSEAESLRQGADTTEGGASEAASWKKQAENWKEQVYPMFMARAAAEERLKYAEVKNQRLEEESDALKEQLEAANAETERFKRDLAALKASGGAAEAAAAQEAADLRARFSEKEREVRAARAAAAAAEEALQQARLRPPAAAAVPMQAMDDNELYEEVISLRQKLQESEDEHYALSRRCGVAEGEARGLAERLASLESAAAAAAAATARAEAAEAAAAAARGGEEAVAQQLGDLQAGAEDSRRKNEVLAAELRRAAAAAEEAGRREEAAREELAAAQRTVAQFKQVVQQMRDVGRNTGAETEKIRSERDALGQRLQKQEAEALAVRRMFEEEVEGLRRQLERVGLNEHAAAEAGELRQQLAATREAASSLQNEYSAAAQRVHELSARLSRAEADLALEKADRAAATSALDNLRAVLETMQTESAWQLKEAEARRVREVESAGEVARVAYAEAENRAVAVWRSKIEAVRQELSAALDAERRRCAIKEGEALRAREENTRLRIALDQATERLSSGQEDSVDRQLAANLVVRYVESRHGRQVLELMARIFAFTPEQMEQVGLITSAGGGGGRVVPVIINALIGGGGGSAGEADGAHDVSAEDIKGDTLSDMWVNFLLQSSGGGEQEQEQKPQGRAVAAAAGAPSDTPKGLGNSVSERRAGAAGEEARRGPGAAAAPPAVPSPRALHSPSGNVPPAARATGWRRPGGWGAGRAGT